MNDRKGVAGKRQAVIHRAERKGQGRAHGVTSSVGPWH